MKCPRFTLKTVSVSCLPCYDFEVPGFSLLYKKRANSCDTSWTSCRDQFQEVMQRDDNIKENGMLLAISDSNNKDLAQSRVRDVATFLRQIEKKLKLRKFTRFGRTNLPGVLYLKPSEFWTKDKMRVSLMTLLLRCGRHYRRNKENFKRALFSDAYAKRTKVAIERFMRGNTYYQESVGSFYEGWLSAFRKQKKVQVNKLLKKKAAKIN